MSNRIITDDKVRQGAVVVEAKIQCHPMIFANICAHNQEYSVLFGMLRCEIGESQNGHN